MNERPLELITRIMTMVIISMMMVMMVYDDNDSGDGR